MSTMLKAAPKKAAVPTSLAKLREQYGCGPIELTGTDDDLYERHLIFDNVLQLSARTARSL